MIQRLTLASVAASLAVLALASCSASGSGGTSSTHAVAGTPKCTNLIGKPVSSDQPCNGDGGTYDGPGSFGCYPGSSGDQQGSGYWYEFGKVTVYGRDGGVWKLGPDSMSIGDMAKALGC